jgi:AcrR family transcriptional regulator
MGKLTQRLGREDWILAGFRALTAGGVGALRVEAIARDLGATKGSFYWHFSDPADWREAMLDYWEDRAFRRILTALEPVPEGLPRLRALVAIATALEYDPAHGGAAAEPALREWARFAPDIAIIVARVDAGRMAFVVQCFTAAGSDANAAARKARLFYAALLGLGALRGSPAEDADAMMRMIDLLQA